MSWEKAKQNHERANDWLDRIRPDLLRISKAPNLDQLYERADRTNTPIEDIIRREIRVMYKSVKTATGDVYLVQNPALMAYQALKHERTQVPRGTIYRRAPKFLMSFEEAKKIIEGKKTDESEEKDGSIKWK